MVKCVEWAESPMSTMFPWLQAPLVTHVNLSHWSLLGTLR
jgi:hypothetical protein